MKSAVRKDMKAANSPVAFWDYCIERKVRIMNVTARERFNLKSTNAYTQLTSEEADISTCVNTIGMNGVTTWDTI